MATLSKASELLLKIKKEPMEYSESCHSLLANAKSAYRQSSLDSPDYDGTTTSLINQCKRKATTEISEQIQKYRKLELLENERFRYLGLENDLQNGHSLSENGAMSKQSHVTRGSEKKYECVLCNDKFFTEEDRMFHVTLVHKSKGNATKRAYTRFARHTCQICFARFRTLRDFFNHTNCHSNEPGLSAIQRSISESIAKNSLQNFYLDTVSSFGRDIVQPSFKCDCCDTIFSNRDSYAMHVMMRVKNREQNGVNNLAEASGTPATDVSNKKEDSSPASDISASDLNHAYYIDVTSIAEKDEYLRTVLDDSSEKSNSGIMPSVLSANTKKCTKCDKGFTDQDSLAMHVMSCHTETPVLAPSGEKRLQQISTANSVIPHSLFSGYVASNGNASNHRIDSNLVCEYCGISCTSRDNLAMHSLSHTIKEPKKDNILNSSINKGDNSSRSSDGNTSTEISTPKSVKTDLQVQPLNLTSSKQPEMAYLASVSTKMYVDRYLSRDEQNQRDEELNIEIENETQSKRYRGTRTIDSPTLNNVRSSKVFPYADKSFYRSSSLPDLRERSCENHEIRSASVSALENVPCKLLVKNERFSDLEYNNSGMDLTTEKIKHRNDSTVQPHSIMDRENARQRSPELKRGKCPVALASDEIDDPRKLLSHIDKTVYICRFCDIIFLNHTLYYLHKGLHNVNNPWQCNMCGKVCANVHDFSAHVIHI